MAKYIIFLIFFGTSCLLAQETSDSTGTIIRRQQESVQKLLSEGEYEKAGEIARDALARAEQENMDDAIPQLMMNLADSHIGMGNFRQAESILKRLMNIYEHNSDRSGMADVLFKMGVMNRIRNKPETAVQQLTRALNYYKSLDEKEKTALTLNELGQAYSKIQTPAAAEEKEIPISQELSLKEGISADIHSRADTVRRQDTQKSKAITLLEESLKEAESLHNKQITMYNYRDLAEVYAKDDDFKKAFQYYRRYSSIRDSIFTSETQEKIAKMMAEHKSQQQAKELEMLKKEGELQRRQQRTQLIFFLVALFLVLLMLAILYSRYRLKKRYVEKLEAINEKLRESESDLKELNATKDRFFSIIAHDLRNPINTFLSSSQFLSERYNQLDKKLILDTIEDINLSAKELNNLLENLLIWSRSQLGLIEFYPEKLNMTELIQHNIAILKNMASEKNIELSCECGNDIPAYADMQAVLTIIKNLMMSAIANSPDGGKVNMFVRPVNGKVEVSVKDFGAEISDDHREKIFTIQDNPLLKKESENRSLGLGLVISAELLETNGGKIWLENSNGGGNDFRFTLPKGE